MTGCAEFRIIGSAIPMPLNSTNGSNFPTSKKDFFEVRNTFPSPAVIPTERRAAMWEELYKTYYPELLRYASSACQSQAAGEELVQDVFLKALQNFATLEDLSTSQRRAWLYKTLKNAIYDRYRHGQVEERYTNSLSEDPFSLDPGMEQVETDLVLEILTPEDRALFTLRYLEGYTASELSEMFHLPAGTIRSRLSRCRVLLKHNLSI